MAYYLCRLAICQSQNSVHVTKPSHSLSSSWSTWWILFDPRECVCGLTLPATATLHTHQTQAEVCVHVSMCVGVWVWGEGRQREMAQNLCVADMDTGCPPHPTAPGSNTEQRALIKTHVSFWPLQAVSLSPPPRMKDQVPPTAPSTPLPTLHTSQFLPTSE